MSNPLSARDVSELIPHRPPMLLIDRLLTHQTDFLQTEVKITEQSTFFDSASGLVPNYVGIEYMAQSIAALAGLEAEARGETVKIGFLLGSRKLTFTQAGYALDHSYCIEVNRLYQEDSGLAVFGCKILTQDTLVASANINVFQPQDTNAYIGGDSKL